MATLIVWLNVCKIGTSLLLRLHQIKRIKFCVLLISFRVGFVSVMTAYRIMRAIYTDEEIKNVRFGSQSVYVTK